LENNENYSRDSSDNLPNTGSWVKAEAIPVTKRHALMTPKVWKFIPFLKMEVAGFSK
jgi:hypothetical protein